MKRHRRIDAVPLQDYLPQVLRSMTPAKRGQLAEIRDVWSDLLGEAMGRRARPVAIDNEIGRAHV